MLISSFPVLSFVHLTNDLPTYVCIEIIIAVQLLFSVLRLRFLHSTLIFARPNTCFRREWNMVLKNFQGRFYNMR